MEKTGLGQVHVFWGNGKGKTTSALGTSLRACGNGYNVHLVQFMKNGASTLSEQIPGEIKSLEKFSNFSYKRFGAGDWYVKGKNYFEHREIVLSGLKYLKESLQNKDYDIIIADEVLYAIQLELISQDELIDIVRGKPKNKELILTGSHKPLEKIFEIADLVTEIKKIKHPYDKGIMARKGIEY